MSAAVNRQRKTSLDTSDNYVNLWNDVEVEEPA